MWFLLPTNINAISIQRRNGRLHPRSFESSLLSRICRVRSDPFGTSCATSLISCFHPSTQAAAPVPPAHPYPHPTPPLGAAAGHEPTFARSVPVQPQKETEQPDQHFPRLAMELGLPSFPSLTPDPQRSRCSGQAWPLWPQ